MTKQVVMGCIHRYDSPLKIAGHFLARSFALRGWDVLFLSAPVTPLHMLQGRSLELRERFRIAFSPTGRTHYDGSLREIIPFSLIAPDGRPLLRSKLVTTQWHRFVLPSLETKITRFLKGPVDLLYVDNIFYHSLFQSIPATTKIFRVMDPHDEFEGWKGRTRAIARKLAEQADVTLYAHPGLESYTRSLHPKTMHCHENGVDYELLSQPAAQNKLLAAAPGPVAVYVGAVDYRLDFSFINTIASEMPNWSFYFFGPVSTALGTTLPVNVHFPGPVTRHELPSILHTANIGFLPYDVAGQPQRFSNVRPLKLLECLAAGLPVVCPRWPGVEQMCSPALLYSTLQECKQAFTTAEKNTAFVDKAQQFARDRDWNIVFDELLRTVA